MNYNAMVSEIQGELNDYSARMKTKIEGWVNECHKIICQKRAWWFLTVKKSDEITLGASDFPMDITADITVSSTVTPAAHINAMFDTTDGVYREVKHGTFEIIRAEDTMVYSQDSAPTYYYYSEENKIDVFPAISADRKFVFSFKKKLSTYASGAATALLIPDDYIDTLKEFVLSRAYRFKSDDRSPECYQNYLEAYSMMVAADAKKTGVTDERVNVNTQLFPMIVDAS